jgi:hypothetical protein
MLTGVAPCVKSVNGWQTPALHCPPWQLCPQLPQLNRSVWKFVQSLLQAFGVPEGQTQAPL